MYKLNNNKSTKIESHTLSELGFRESDIEELLRNDIGIIGEDEDEESLLIIGQQVKNAMYGRSDLTAIDKDGSLVLIEIKRDKKDMEARREAFEFQAIRYAASYAIIESKEYLVKHVYAPYIEKYKNEFELGELTPYEFGIRKINDFLKFNNALEKFNHSQRIILVASDFDEQTLSAVAWLNKNNVDMSCFKLTPYKIGDEIFIQNEKLLPIASHKDFYVNLLTKNEPTGKTNKSIVRRRLPKIDSMLEWGVVSPGDVILAKDREDEAVLLKNGNVKVGNKEISMAIWLKNIYGWSSIQTYAFAIHKKTGKSLSQIREKYMEELLEEQLEE